MKTLIRILVRGFFFAVLAMPIALQAQTSEWIWHDNKGSAPADNEIRFFRKTFTVGGPVIKAVLTVAGDDQATVYLNGKQVAVSRGWNKATSANVTSGIKNGENLIAARGKNESGD